MTILGLGILLILAGLTMCWLSSQAKYPLLVTVVFWLGIIFIVVGIVLVLTPILLWLNVQLRAMLAAG